MAGNKGKTLYHSFSPDSTLPLYSQLLQLLYPSQQHRAWEWEAAVSPCFFLATPSSSHRAPEPVWVLTAGWSPSQTAPQAAVLQDKPAPLWVLHGPQSLSGEPVPARAPLHWLQSASGMAPPKGPPQGMSAPSWSPPRLAREFCSSAHNTTSAPASLTLLSAEMVFTLSFPLSPQHTAFVASYCYLSAFSLKCHPLGHRRDELEPFVSSTGSPGCCSHQPHSPCQPLALHPPWYLPFINNSSYLGTTLSALNINADNYTEGKT